MRSAKAITSTAGRQPGRQALGRGELARQRSDAGEHRDDRDDRERQVGRAARGKPAGEEGDEEREPEHGRAGADRSELGEEASGAG